VNLKEWPDMPAYLFGEVGGNKPADLLSRVAVPSRSLVPESFRGGCSFGAGQSADLFHEAQWHRLGRTFAGACQRLSAAEAKRRMRSFRLNFRPRYLYPKLVR
jgi:hypothetical protein